MTGFEPATAWTTIKRPSGAPETDSAWQADLRAPSIIAVETRYAGDIRRLSGVLAEMRISA
jgi:hypothetical protein